MYFLNTEFAWCRTGFTNLIKVKVKRKNAKSWKEKKEKRKERKKEQTLTNSIARIRACASRSAVAVGFACRNLHHAAKKARHVRSLNILSGTIMRPTVWKRSTSHTVSNANKIKNNLDQNKPRANGCSNFRSRDLNLGKAFLNSIWRTMWRCFQK